MIKKCNICKKDFETATVYSICCSSLCKKIYYDRRNIKTMKTSLEKYGTTSPNQSSIVKSKKRTTCLEKYGEATPLKSELIKDKIKQTCLEKYGVENPNKNKDIRNKIKQTCLEKYGEICYIQTETFIEKSKTDNLIKYGVEYYFQTEEFREKHDKKCLECYGDKNYNNRDEAKNTCLEKYGVENPNKNKDIIQKTKQTNLDKYGVECNLHSKQSREKIKQTCLEKYGVEHWSQDVHVHKKQRGRWKSYILPSGKEIKIQGYENKFLDEYFIDGGKEEDMISDKKSIPKIWYFNSDDGKNHRYYPDFYIPKDNLIIEVKSTWTYKRDLEINLLKEKACKDIGYDFKFKIYE